MRKYNEIIKFMSIYTAVLSQFLPSVNLVTNMAETVSPVAFKTVAMGSTRVPMIITTGNISTGKP
jgi:hypothetical protein